MAVDRPVPPRPAVPEPVDAPRPAQRPPAVPKGSALRVISWVLHLAIPAVALWMLVARPELDLSWDHRITHFGLVLAAAGVAVTLSVVMGRAARDRRDARLFLVSLAFGISAGFLAAHALATPGVLLASSSAGFVAATPIGLLLGGVAALASSVEFTPAGADRLLRRQRMLAAAPLVLPAGWVAASLGGLPPLGNPPRPIETETVPIVAAIVGGALYLVAAVRYLGIYRRRPSPVLLSVLTAFVLLAQALFAIMFARSWHLSWWEWHVLMALAYCFIGYAAHVQFRREGSARGLFDAVTLERTVADLRRDYAAALEAMVDVLQRSERGEDVPLGPAGSALAARFGLTEQQVAVLERSAHALGAEREQVRKLGGLVAVGRETSLIRGEDDLLDRVRVHAAAAFPRDEIRIGLVRSGELSFPEGPAGSPARRAAETGKPVTDGPVLVLPLSVKGRAAGVLEARPARGRFGEADTVLLGSFASQASIALENARLYQQLDGLFRSYMSPAVATALIADPDQADLGGAVAEVSVLMADLRGFTPFAEDTAPDQVVAMLNTYYGAVVPVILAEGGTVVQFVGDAVMAIWGAPARQPNHAHRAARAGLHLHRAVEIAAAGRREWPRFRVGINSGPALVGNVGAAQLRNFTAIGDTTNLAARLEGLAEPGQVVIGPVTRAQLGSAATVRTRGPVRVKGRREPVEVFVLHDLGEQE
ncbi:adenylate/guanylate cyclase domain-containing protein [Pseudonocardia asaccharolytica]|nr:adenylate/guanylate cyclase domain-containing protein [Pseudonocardia asaccharolytica]